MINRFLFYISHVKIVTLKFEEKYDFFKVLFRRRKFENAVHNEINATVSLCIETPLYDIPRVKESCVRLLSLAAHKSTPGFLCSKDIMQLVV